jgi:hypothetical protein
MDLSKKPLRARLRASADVTLRMIFAALAMLCLSWSAIAAERAPRLLVLTDIEADPDDTQSLIRLLLYANEIDLEGLVATTSTHMPTTVFPESIRAVINAYGKVHGNLLKHSPDYPAPATLAALIKKGRAEYGMAGVGVGKDTEGSEWIIRRLEADDARPLWISVWGGANTLAQALHTLRATRPAARVEQLVKKLRVYTISDQDDAGPWIRKEFPGLFYIVSPGGDYSKATWMGVNVVVSGIDNTTISNAWLAKNIQQGHGPLGAAYPDVSWGVEGDTPAFLGLIPNGLSVPERPEWGGWGGRYELYLPEVPVSDPKTFIGGVPIPAETRPIWTNAVDEYSPPLSPEYGRATRNGDKPFRDFKASLWRWRDDFQNDFAARMDWTTQPYAQANHPPVAKLSHPDAFNVKSGQGFGLDARPSTDPDGDSLSYLWSVYPEAGTFKGGFKIGGAENSAGLWIKAPQVESEQTLHFILRVTDKGSPPLTRYRRVIVTIAP